MKRVEVVAAIIYHGEEILCVQRPKNKYPYISEKFEFPGGKIESGETKEEALKRELLEELDINPVINAQFDCVEHQYPDFYLKMHLYNCEVSSKVLNLREHISQKWLKKEDMLDLDWAEADIPVVKKILSNG